MPDLQVIDIFFSCLVELPVRHLEIAREPRVLHRRKKKGESAKGPLGEHYCSGFELSGDQAGNSDDN